MKEGRKEGTGDKQRKNRSIRVTISTIFSKMLNVGDNALVV